METFLAIINEIKAWVKLNFADKFEIESIEINPIIFPSVEQTLKKEFFAKNPLVLEAHLGIYAIEGIKVIRSSNPFSGIHIRLRDISEKDEYYPSETS